MAIVITNCEVEGRGGLDVRIDDGRIVAIGRLRPQPGDEPLDAEDGALLPGLHDHHVHLRALAAMAGSVRVGPADVHDPGGFQAALRSATSPDWIRGVGYHEALAGPLDAIAVDAVVADRPVRIQHRTGALWVLNSEALRRVGAEQAQEPGIERDATGRPTGRLWRMDQWLAARVPPTPTDLGPVGRTAAARGITGFTDADPGRTPADVADLIAALDDGRLPQRVHAMGPVGLRVPSHPRLSLGPVKVLLDDDSLPELRDLEAIIEAAHSEQRPIAIHCVTRLQLVFALAAIDAAGAAPGDRIEHGSVLPLEVIPEIVRLGLTVVTQPGFVAERGDQYLTDVDADDLPHLYRIRSLLDAGVSVALSTDAPYTDPDPWRALAAAVERKAPSGTVVGPAERVDAATALRLLAAHPTERLEVGARADLCLLETPIADALRHTADTRVRATLVAGALVHLVT